MVTEDELADLLKREQWTLGRGKTGKQKVFSAKRHRKGGSISRYIGTEQKLKEMSEADVLAKLNKL